MSITRRQFLISLPALAAAVQAYPEGVSESLNQLVTGAGETSVDQRIQMVFPDGTVWRFLGNLVREGDQVRITSVGEMEISDVKELPATYISSMHSPDSMHLQGTRLSINKGPWSVVTDIEGGELSRIPYDVTQDGEDARSYLLGRLQRMDVKVTTKKG